MGHMLASIFTGNVKGGDFAVGNGEIASAYGCEIPYVLMDFIWRWEYVFSRRTASASA